MKSRSSVIFALSLAAAMPARASCWHVTVLSHDGQSLVAHHTAEDWKEVQGICTIERSKSLMTRIVIRSPLDEPRWTWD